MHSWIALIVCLFALTCCGGGTTGDASNVETPSPSVTSSLEAVTVWEDRMLEFGTKLCNPSVIRELSTWEGNIWYYDGIRTYYQIADYTGSSAFAPCIEAVKQVYRDYVLSNNGNIPAWRVFPHGLAIDYQRTRDEQSKSAIIALAVNSPFAQVGGGENFELSRETAYLLHAYRFAELLGAGPFPQKALAKSYALSHINQWVGSQTASNVKPFMVGLTFEALIALNDNDPEVVAAIENATEWLWQNAYDPASQSFFYVLCRTEETEECHGYPRDSAPDLNLLIAPAYSWIHSLTKNPLYKQRALLLLEGANRGAYIDQGKQFNQSYRWSFDLIFNLTK